MAQNSTEKKRALNAIDVLLIIIAIGIIALVVVNIVRQNPNIVSGGNKQISYVIQVNEVYDALTDNVKVGDKLYDNASGQLIGEVTDVSVSRSQKVGYDLSGDVVYTPIEGKSDIAITLKVSVWSDGGVLKIDSYRISVGMEISCHSPNISVTGRCVSITEA